MVDPVKIKVGDKLIHQGEEFTVRLVEPPHSLFGWLIYFEEKLGGFNPVNLDYPTTKQDEPEPTASSEDVVTKPSHYTRWVIEPVTFVMRNGFEFWRGNIIKYASRAGYKLYPNQDERESEITDLKKVIRYAEMRINQLEGETVL